MENKIMDAQADYELKPPANRSEMQHCGLISRNGPKNFFVSNSCPQEKNKISLQWMNLTYKSKNGTRILNGLYGSSNSGELTAIMGPSGAGKTTLVNILSGFVQKGVGGQVLVNGAKREMRSFRRLTCYILQDDYVLPRFTVRELITFASNLKIPSTVSDKEKQKAVDDCIYGLGLVGQQHQRASTLSGGQRKRLCIAQEIVNNPPLIFLDEPTSGLDSSSCLQCVLLLKRLAEQGKNIICTIHQPSSRIYEIFDNLYMISDGDCIYRGPTKDLLPYLEKKGSPCPKYHSPTDFLTDIAIGLYGEWLDKLKEAINAEDSEKDNWNGEAYANGLVRFDNRNSLAIKLSLFKEKVKEILLDSWHDIKSNEYPTSDLNQFRVLVKRSFLNQIREPIHMQLKFFGSIFIGLLLGSMFYNTGNDGSKVFNTAGLLFTLMIFLVITAKIPTVLTFPLQRIIFDREHRNGWYSTKMYYLAITAAEMPYQIICPVINCGLLYWLSGQPYELHRICFFMLSGILTALISESVGLMIGAVSNVQNGIFTSAVLISASIAFSGVHMPYESIPSYLKLLGYLTYSRPSLKCFVLAIYENRGVIECKSNFFCLTSPEKLLKGLGIEDSLYTNIGVLVLILIAYRIFVYFFLRVSVSES